MLNQTHIESLLEMIKVNIEKCKVDIKENQKNSNLFKVKELKNLLRYFEGQEVAYSNVLLIEMEW